MFNVSRNRVKSYIKAQVNKMTDLELESLLNYLAIQDELSAKGNLQGVGKINKKIISIDFDGVICERKGKWKGNLIIDNKPVSGALEFLRSLLHDERFIVYIFSSRCKNKMFDTAFKGWASKYGLSYDDMEGLNFAATKPPAFVQIDDRCIRFDGAFPSAEEILNYKTWYE